MPVLGRALRFYRRLICHPVPLFFGLAFIAAKIWSNVSYGGSLLIGLRSGIMGLLAYALALGMIHVLSDKPKQERFKASLLDPARARQASILVALVYLFILGAIIDRLQTSGYVGGRPIYGIIPGLHSISRMLEGLALGDIMPGAQDFMLANIVRGLPFYVLIPLLLLHGMGLRRGDFGLTGGDIKPALPLLTIYILALAFSGITLEKIVFLLYTLLYVGIQEEFFFRGVMQPLFIGALRSPSWGAGLSVLLFALLHVPDFVFRLYPTTAVAFGNVASVALFGGLMAYGTYRTGMLWPWMLIHALSNVMGW